jgi:hypothetical protein
MREQDKRQRPEERDKERRELNGAAGFNADRGPAAGKRSRGRAAAHKTASRNAAGREEKQGTIRTARSPTQ